MLAAMAFAIVLDVVVRNLGLQPPAHTLTLTEYGLLYLTMLAAPWLVREKGHVHIELVTAALPPRARFWLTRVVYALCVLTCAVIFYFGLEVTIAHYQRSVIDVRSFDMPRWLLHGEHPAQLRPHDHRIRPVPARLRLDARGQGRDSRVTDTLLGDCSSGPGAASEGQAGVDARL